MGAPVRQHTESELVWELSAFPGTWLYSLPPPLTPCFPVKMLSLTNSTALSYSWLLRLSSPQKSVVNKMLVIIK